MAKSKVTPIRRDDDPINELYEAMARLNEIRCALICSSEILSDSAFSGGNSITEERDCAAILVLENVVKRLSAFQAEVDAIHVKLAQPIALRRLAEVANG